VDILIVSDEVAFDTLSLAKRSFAEQRDIRWKQRLRTFGLRNPSLRMHFQPFFQRKLQTAQIQISRRGFRVSAAVSHVNLLVGIHNEVVQSIVPVKIEQTDVDTVHPDNASADKLLQKFAKF
jgi:hypothetical protein